MSTMRLSTTGSTAITTTLALDPKRAFQINEIELHLNGAGGATGDVDFTVTKDANAGTPYDLLLLTEDMTTDTDVLYQPELPLIFDKGDEVDFAYANGSSKTYGLTVVYELL